MFELRHLRSAGQRWLHPADILPCFFKNNTVDNGCDARNSTSPVESPMQGNKWRPVQPGGGERPTFLFHKKQLHYLFQD